MTLPSNSLPFTAGSRRAAAAGLLATLLAVSSAAAQTTAAAVRAAPLSAAERATLEKVDAATIRKVVEDLSSEAMEGRGTATPGGERAARYIADRFKALGLKPAGENGTYFQAVPFRSKRLLPSTTFAVGGTSLDYGRDFVVFTPLLTDSFEASAELVLAGFGVSAPEAKRDDFAGVDLKGKVVVVLQGTPKGVDEATWKPAASQQAVMRNLIMRGAAAIVIAGFESEKATFEQLANYVGRQSVQLASTPEPPVKLPPTAILSPEGSRKLFAAAGADYEALRAKALEGEAVSRALGATANVSVDLEKKTVTGTNVVAVLEGSDPALKGEAVLYSAHYDAFGLAPDGGYYPGAADNALGVGEIVAIAEAAAKGPARPRRSMLFLALTGEEFGLLGAEHWAQSPTWPLSRVAANINYDGIGTEVFGPVKEVVGFGREYSTLGAVLEGVAPALGVTLIADPMPEEKAFYRSDHYAFVKRGVPALMLLGAPGSTKEWVARAYKWIQTDYHQKTDVIRPDWNWEGPRTIAAVGLLVGLRVATEQAAPVWLESSPFQRPAAKAA